MVYWAILYVHIVLPGSPVLSTSQYPSALLHHRGERRLFWLISGSEAAYTNIVVRGNKRSQGKIAYSRALPMPAIQIVKGNTLCEPRAQEQHARGQVHGESHELGLEGVLEGVVLSMDHTTWRSKGCCKEGSPEDRAANCEKYERKQPTLPGGSEVSWSK